MDRIIILFVGLAIAIVAAYYSIIGLTSIFSSPAAFIPIVIMGTVLEVGKIITASWMFRNWSAIPFLMRIYFSTAVIVLMLITSMGIFGFLTKSHIDQTMVSGGNALQIEMIEQRIAVRTAKLNDAGRVIEQLDKAVEVLIKYDRIRGPFGSLAVRERQEPKREALNGIIDTASARIAILYMERLKLSKAKLKVDAETGVAKYIAELFYGDEADKMVDTTVRAVILLIVFSFDPLAILLIVAAGGIGLPGVQLPYSNGIIARTKRKVKRGTERFTGN